MRYFFTKLAGGESLQQSVCVLLFPRGMLFCRRSLQCNSVEGLSLVSVPSHEEKKKIKAANLHLKWYIVGLWSKRGQIKRRGFLECRETQFVFYLFALIVGSVWDNQHSSIDGSNKDVEMIVDVCFYASPDYVLACLTMLLQSIYYCVMIFSYASSLSL